MNFMNSMPHLRLGTLAGIPGSPQPPSPMNSGSLPATGDGAMTLEAFRLSLMASPAALKLARLGQDSLACHELIVRTKSVAGRCLNAEAERLRDEQIEGLHGRIAVHVQLQAVRVPPTVCQGSA